MGRDKRMVTVGGRPLARRACDVLREVVEEVAAIAPDPGPFPALGVPTRPERRAGAGPLAGIEAALLWAGERAEEVVLVVPCDLPFLTPALLRSLLALPGPRDRPRVVEGQPLVGAYPGTGLPLVTAALERGERSAGKLLANWPHLTLSRAGLRSLGDPELLLLNVNTPADHARARQAARRIRTSTISPGGGPRRAQE